MDTNILSIDLLKTLLVFFTSLMLSLIILPHIYRFALMIGLVDYPNGRKIHDIPKPLGGGFGMIIAFAISCILFIPLKSIKGLSIGIFILLIIGFLDDLRK